MVYQKALERNLSTARSTIWLRRTENTRRSQANFLGPSGNISGQMEGPVSPISPLLLYFWTKNDKNYVEPDICVICDPSKLNDNGCSGAPDWIIEIVSPSSRVMDYYTKLSLYREAGVCVYWIVDPMEQAILIYDMEQGTAPTICSFDDTIQAEILGDLKIDFSAIAGSSNIWLKGPIRRSTVRYKGGRDPHKSRPPQYS